MITNRLSASLSTSDQEAVMSAIGVIEQKLSFLIDLTTAERIQMAKLGDKSAAAGIFLSTAGPATAPCGRRRRAAGGNPDGNRECQARVLLQCVAAFPVEWA